MSRLRGVLAASSFLAVLSCRGGPLPASLAGTWTGRDKVGVRVQDPRGGPRFVSDTVAISLTIDADGRAKGYVGGAVLENAYVVRNRGWFGRRLHIGTDFRLEGRLQGHLFAADPIPTKDVLAPFDLRGDTLAGGLAQRVRMGIYPMVLLRLPRR